MIFHISFGVNIIVLRPIFAGMLSFQSIHGNFEITFQIFFKIVMTGIGLMHLRVNKTENAVFTPTLPARHIT